MMNEDIYRCLQQRLDQYSLGFPKTETGIELLILKKLFTKEDAEMFLKMTPRLENPESVARRIGASEDAVARQLEDMASHGLLFRVRKGTSVQYGAIPFMHGLIEFQVKKLDQEMGMLLKEYLNQAFNKSITDVEGMFLRTVPIEKSIVAEHHIASFDDAVAMIMKNETIAVTECLCRKGEKIMGRGCGKPDENCMMFGSMARYYIDNQMGRPVSKEEAVEILRQAQAAGLVTQPATAQNPSGMCNCCGDCCVVLGAVKKHSKPAQLVFSNYRACLNREDCIGCEVCLDRCQMGALTMNEDGVAQLNPDRCIGCGLCVTTCPSDALRLEAKPEALRRVPPANGVEQMMQIAINRGVISSAGDS